MTALRAVTGIKVRQYAPKKKALIQTIHIETTDKDWQ